MANPAAANVFSTTIAAVPLHVRAALEAFAAFLEDAGVAKSKIALAELAVAEVLNNIVEHAYNNTDTGQIGFCANLAGDLLNCRFQDNGRQMPHRRTPLGHRYSNEELQALPEGGYGWHLVHDIASNTTYSRQDGQNIFRLSMDLAIDSAPAREI